MYPSDPQTNTNETDHRFLLIGTIGRLISSPSPYSDPTVANIQPYSIINGLIHLFFIYLRYHRLTFQRSNDLQFLSYVACFWSSDTCQKPYQLVGPGTPNIYMSSYQVSLQAQSSLSWSKFLSPSNNSTYDLCQKSTFFRNLQFS